MSFSLADWIIGKIGHWLLHQAPPRRKYLCDFAQIGHTIRPADVLLIEGRSRVSRIIRHVTQSPWSHAVLYIGRLQDIKDKKMRDRIKLFCDCTPEQQLVIESEIGKGTIISPIEKYKDDHIRILRPEWLAKQDVGKVIDFALDKLGRKYDVRHLLDLARFLMPWGIFPRRWRSSLFQHNALQPTEDICSSMIADAFQSVHYPIFPPIHEGDKNHWALKRRNSRLYTPSDFDYSPFFFVIKYPIFPMIGENGYAHLPWVDDIGGEN
ncbi:MAG: YiiX/YebB-like N1pC/P60 family cysteine hydrolase [Legionellaceae bacterium]|nr:YiiX/YebB-like N1pC/P60 family cysteine hydrolase [Legionellaceae bacterium]